MYDLDGDGMITRLEMLEIIEVLGLKQVGVACVVPGFSRVLGPPKNGFFCPKPCLKGPWVYLCRA